MPLFIEELTNTLLESGLLRETTDRYVLDGPLPPLAVPTTLQASLVARLDRLGSIKDVAQVGAAIGREFSHELIAAVSALAAMDLDAALERLTASGLISRRGTPPDATYSFKHALVQDAAYVTMLKSRRRQLHSSIATVLVEQFPAMVERLPEVIAQHYTEAALASEAIAYWRKAGRLAQARSAHREAVTSFEQALRLLEAQPETRERLEQAIDLRFDLRNALFPLGEFERVFGYLQEAEGPGEDARRSTTARAAIRLPLPQPCDDWSSDGSARVRPGRPGHCRVAWGCFPPGDGKSLPRRGLPLHGRLSTGRGPSPERTAVP